VLHSAWVWGGDPDSIHILLLVYGKDEKALNEQLGQRKAELAKSSGTVLVKELSAGRQPDSKEHFGFADGIGQPVIEGNERHEKKPKGTHRACDCRKGRVSSFLATLTNMGYLPPAPPLMLPMIPVRLLPRYEVPLDLRFADQSMAKDLRDLGFNGSYLVSVSWHRT